MKEFIDKLIERLEGREKYYHECALDEIMENGHTLDAEGFLGKEDAYGDAISIVNHIAEEYINCSINTSTDCSTKVSEMPTGWIPCSERLPESENKYGWVSCIVSVIRSHYPTSPYDICDSPYDENIVMHANYNVSQKIWHLECDEQLNALIDIEDAPLNGDYVIAWQPLPAPFKEGE